MTPNSSEYKSVIGLDQLYVAEVTQDDSGAYVADTPEVLAPAAEVSIKPVASQETQYANNQAYDVFSSEAETDLEITVTGLPAEMRAKLLGSVFDVSTGRVFENAGNPPWIAFGFRSLKSNGSYRYYWFLKTMFSPSEEGAATKADKATPQTAKLACKAVKTEHKWALNGSITDSVKRVWGDEDTTNFDETDWFTQVQTPATVAPSALALSSSDPADGAAAVAVSKTITLTFNNALPADAIANVVVVKADGTAVACTNSLDATKKIMTVNPNADLDAASTYIVAYGVTDIYGQTLNGAINFGTA